VADQQSNCQQAKPKTYRYVFRSIAFDELPEPLEWAIEDIMPLNGITCLFGLPGGFKTFEAIAAACCKATGLEFCGRWVGPPCRVGYIAADSPRASRSLAAPPS
jgi:hypothetical protein